MGYVTENKLHEIAKSLVELNQSYAAFNNTLNKFMSKFGEVEKNCVEIKEDTSGWIKINTKEDCPKTNDQVLIRCELSESLWWFGEYHVAKYIQGSWDAYNIYDVEDEYSVRVTHWRPIPKL